MCENKGCIVVCLWRALVLVPAARRAQGGREKGGETRSLEPASTPLLSASNGRRLATHSVFLLHLKLAHSPSRSPGLAAAAAAAAQARASAMRRIGEGGRERDHEGQGGVCAACEGPPSVRARVRASCGGGERGRAHTPVAKKQSVRRNRLRACFLATCRVTELHATHRARTCCSTRERLPFWTRQARQRPAVVRAFGRGGWRWRERVGRSHKGNQ